MKEAKEELEKVLKLLEEEMKTARSEINSSNNIMEEAALQLKKDRNTQDETTNWGFRREIERLSSQAELGRP